MIKVLFVCLGNICRSPAAEAVFSKIVSDKNSDDKFSVDSAGTSGLHTGEKADARMREIAKKRGINITSISRKLSENDLFAFDKIIAMDKSNIVNISKLSNFEDYSYKVSLLTDYKQKMEFNEVPDPYYGGEDGFELVLDIVTDSCEGLYNSLTSYKM
ncbi:MAG: low molecular weight phosphotyrosine protein phosphatase [Halobacteriovoraceae bacterium]|nr:low molecular weight phosphotyrosine protein phosphatase [Halobacteriovoraceae bacterium]